MEKHLNNTVLNNIQQNAFKKLDEKFMIDKPDLNQFVFVQCIQDNIIIGTETKNTGDFLIVRYNQIRQNYLNNEVEMLL